MDTALRAAGEERERRKKRLANVLFIDVDVHDAKSTIAYMVKYVVKDSVEINASATALDNAAEHSRKHPSTVDDKDVPERS